MPFFAALPPSFAAPLLYVQTPCQRVKVKKVLRVLKVLRGNIDKALPFWQILLPYFEQKYGLRPIKIGISVPKISKKTNTTDMRR